MISSFDLIEGLEGCPLIMVADGIKLQEGRPKWNQGKISEERYQLYLEYVDSLRSQYEDHAYHPAKVIGPLKKRVNFAHALLRGLEEVETEHVLVVQHDRVFAERFSMSDVIELFQQYQELRYVGFQTVPDYTTYAASKFGKWVRCALPEPGLIPCFMWYDSTHVCRTRQLAKLIEQEVKEGEFIESSYGCRLLATCEVLNTFFVCLNIS